MAAADYKLIIDQGSTFQLRVTWKDSNGDPVDLTPYSARLMLRTDYEAASPTISLTSSSGITLGGAAGTIDIEMTASQTSGLVPCVYVYDLELVNGSTVYKLIRGDAIVRAEATK